MEAPLADEATREFDREGPIVLGIDPGTRVVGYGAVAWVRGSARYVRCGVIRPKRGLKVPERLGAIRAGLDGVIARLRPKVVVVEEAFVARSVQSALRIGEGRGVALSCATVAGARIEQMPPAVAKKALTGNGGAHKEQVAAMVVRALNLPSVPQPDDATDALALALAWLQRRTSIPTGNPAGNPTGNPTGRAAGSPSGPPLGVPSAPRSA